MKIFMTTILMFFFTLVAVACFAQTSLGASFKLLSTKTVNGKTTFTAAIVAEYAPLAQNLQICIRFAGTNIDSLQAELETQGWSAQTISTESGSLCLALQTKNGVTPVVSDTLCKVSGGIIDNVSGRSADNTTLMPVLTLTQAPATLPVSAIAYQEGILSLRAEGLQTVRCYTLTGVLVHEVNLSGNVASLPIVLPTGIYLVTLTAANQQQVAKKISVMR